MALSSYQQAVSDLAKRLGLRGAAESQVYQRPEYQQLVQQLFGSIPLPAGIDPSQIISNSGSVLEYKDAEGYVHRLERDLNGLSSTLGQVKETTTNRPPILPPPPEQAAAEQNIIQQSLGNLSARFQNPPALPPAPPDLSGLYQQYGNLGQRLSDFSTRAPALPDFSSLFSQLNQPVPNAPTMPDLSGLNQQYGNLQGQLGQVFSQLMQPTQLAQLQGSDLANLQAIKAASDAQLQQQFGRGQDTLLARLYGQGTNQSTIANQATADLLQAQGMLQLQANADAASRQLGLQQFLTQTGQGNLALAGQTAASGFQGLGQQGQLALGQGQLALGGYEAQQQARMQQLQTLAQALGTQGNLALGGFQAETGANLNALGLLGSLLGQQGQLALGQGSQNLAGYSAYQGAQSDFFGQMISQLNALNNLDLSRQVSSGQLGLGQQQLAEQQRQFNVQISQQQEQQRAQERAARDAFTRQLISAGIGTAASLATGGLSSLFSGFGNQTMNPTQAAQSAAGTNPLKWF